MIQDVELTDEELLSRLEVLTQNFEEIIDGELVVLVAASMGRALGEAVQDPEMLKVAISTVAANAIRGHETLLQELQQAAAESMTKH